MSDQTSKPKRGRPEKPASEKRGHFTARVKATTKARIEAIAKATGISQGELLDLIFSPSEK